MAGRKDLIQAFRDRAGLTVRESALCVDAFAEWIEETLVSGRSIELRGLGTFIEASITTVVLHALVSSVILVFSKKYCYR